MVVNIDSKLGSRLRARRVFLNLPLEEVASEINLTPGYLALVERGRRSLKLEELSRLLDILKLNLDDLVDEEQFFLEQEIINSFEQLNNDDLRIVLKICKLLISPESKQRQPNSMLFFRI